MEKQKRKLGLVPKLIIGIILGILLGQPFVPEVIARLVVTASSLFSLFLKFVIPLMILAYVTMGIADLSQGRWQAAAGHCRSGLRLHSHRGLVLLSGFEHSVPLLYER